MSEPFSDEARNELEAMLQGNSGQRLFTHVTGHPARPTGFCFCDHSVLAIMRMSARSILLQSVLAGPFNRPKLSLLRYLGAKVGKNVYISPGMWVDPFYPQLVEIEEEVFFGMGVRLTTHEFRRDEFRAGRVILRRGAFIGAHAMIGCGVEIGENASVAAGAVVGGDVPAGCTAIGNPARIVRGTVGTTRGDQP
jgi:acetyltransferase-like isoleucine patch superfamily enzyme